MRTHRTTARTARRGLAAAAILAVFAATAAVPASATDTEAPVPHVGTAPAGVVLPDAAPAGAGAHSACDLPSVGHVACLAIVGDALAAPRGAAGHATSSADDSEPHAYTAAELRAAYGLPSALLGARQTVAVVVAYDAPNAAADLNVYRTANGLPACDEDFPCFRKVDQRGGTDLPEPDGGWSLEASLDLDMVSAVCPNCQLLLVEADDSFDESLAAAVDTAVRLGADVVSNSYGTAGEYPEEMEIAPHYDHPGTVMVAATGDSAFGLAAPSVYSSVVAVGGTSLWSDGAGGWSETAWSGAGSGCSAYVAKPKWQHDKLCDKRTVADVAAVADPTTPVAMYDTYLTDGWIEAAGTSVAAPIVAGSYALAGNARDIDANSFLYAHARTSGSDATLRDVTTGFQGETGATGYCGGSYLCTTVGGYDGPTGLGSPHGIAAF